MSKPPQSGPHSDLDGVNRDARVNVPNRKPEQGTAESTEQANAESAGTPDGERSTSA